MEQMEQVVKEEEVVNVEQVDQVKQVVKRLELLVGAS